VISSAPSRSTPLFDAVDARIREAVARVAATEPDPLDPFRGLYISDEGALRTAADGPPPHAAGALADVTAELGLGPLDGALLAVCAAPELDARYGRLLAYLHDDVTRRLPTPRLAARLLAQGDLSEGAVLACFDEAAPLRRSGAVRLVDDDPLLPLADRPIKLDPLLAARLLGTDLTVPGSAPRARRVPVPAHDPGRPRSAAALRGARAAESGLPLVAVGPDAAELLAWALGRAVLLVDARDAATDDSCASARARAALEGAELVLELPSAPAPEDRQRVRAALDLLGEPPLLCARRRSDVDALDDVGPLVVDVPQPSLAERRELWLALAVGDGGAVEEVAARFRLSLGQIDHAARLAKASAAARGDAHPSPEDLVRGAREASRTRLGALATLLEGGREWDELVVPDGQRQQLRSISAYLRHRDRVLSQWGYDAVAGSQGMKVLFAGESGTGKTMAAQVIATDLGLDVFRVDLATVVSKYIGETERNLDRIFEAAEGSNAILFFDEADALFGKRSEVKDAHDRYANIEVAYLLQRMESYPGAVVLATNYRRNIDEAFLRRLDFAIDFPFPETVDRARIWTRVLPDAAPVARDVDVDALAARFELAGGSIRNCSLSAAFMAADDGGTIAMRHLVSAAAAEYRKIGRLAAGTD
jgi:hypothetical protein